MDIDTLNEVDELSTSSISAASNNVPLDLTSRKVVCESSDSHSAALLLTNGKGKASRQECIMPKAVSTDVQQPHQQIVEQRVDLQQRELDKVTCTSICEISFNSSFCVSYHELHYSLFPYKINGKSI